MQFEQSSRRGHTGFQKPETSFDSSLDKEYDAANSKILSAERSGDKTLSSSIKEQGDGVNVKASSYRTSTSQASPSAEPVTEVTRTNVSCVATPTVDRDGKPVIETVTKTVREVNGQQMPTETVRSKIPLEEIQALQGGEQPLLEQQKPRSRRSSLKSQAKGAVDQASASAAPAIENAKQKGAEAWDSTKQKGSEVLNQAQEKGAEKWDQAKEQGAIAMDKAKIKGSAALDQAKVKGSVALDQAKIKGSEAMEQAKVQSSEMMGQAKDWVNENAPKAQQKTAEVLNQGATATQEWVSTNAPKAQAALQQGLAATNEWIHQTAAPKAQVLLQQGEHWVEENAPRAKAALQQGAIQAQEKIVEGAHITQEWVQTNAPRWQQWANSTIADIQLRLRRVNWVQVRRQLKDLAPLLASLFLAIALGSYLYRNAGPLGLNKSNEQLVPVSPVRDVPLSGTNYPQTHDYYMNENAPHRVDELSNKASELKDRAASSLRSAADSLKDSALNAKEWAYEKSSDLSAQASDLSDRARYTAGDLKDQLQDQSAHMQHRARAHAHHAQREAHHQMRQGEKQWQQTKDQAGDWMEQAKDKVQDLKDSASDMAQQAKSKLSSSQAKGQAGDLANQAQNKWSELKDNAADMAQQAKNKLNAASDSIRSSAASTPATPVESADLNGQSPAFAGPYGEINTPPHQHTYPHTLGGAADYVKDKVGEGLQKLGRHGGMPQAEPLR